MDSWNTSLVSELDVPDDPGIETFLWHIYRKNKFTDVEFELGTPEQPVTFSAHKMVLAMWSPIFEDMFYKEERNLVSLEGVNPQAFEALLRFMYGCQPILDSCKNVCDLYKVAIKFKVSRLADLCQKFLLEADIKVSNVFDLLEIAKYMQNEIVIKRCLLLIETETEHILESYDLSNITPSMVEMILKSPKLSLHSEFGLILWMFVWAKNRYVGNYIYSSIREVLYDFLPYLDFLSLSNAQFATICKNYNNFFTDDEALKIFMNIGILNSAPMPDWYDAKANHRTYTGKKPIMHAILRQEW